MSAEPDKGVCGMPPEIPEDIGLYLQRVTRETIDWWRGFSPFEFSEEQLLQEMGRDIAARLKGVDLKVDRGPQLSLEEAIGLLRGLYEGLIDCLPAFQNVIGRMGGRPEFETIEIIALTYRAEVLGFIADCKALMEFPKHNYDENYGDPL